MTAALCHAQASATPISKETATRIALTAAGCKKVEDCIAEGHFDHGKWVFTIIFVAARDTPGKPLIPRGGLMGITLDSLGNVIDKTPAE